MSTYVPTDKVNKNFYVTISATPTVPIKVVENHLNKTTDQPLVIGQGLTTVTVAITCSKNSRKKKVLRVLLDSGSDGDLLFLKEGTPSMFLFKKRILPQKWRTSNGTFETSIVGKVDLKFPEFSLSKLASLQPDIITIPKDEPNPTYDLILGVDTLSSLGVILDFND